MATTLFALHLGASPTTAGAMLTLATLPVMGLVLLWRRKRPLPRPAHVARGRQGGVMALLRLPALRHTLIASGLLNIGWDIYSFLMPLYGSRIGLAPSTIGTIMSCLAVATFVVRAVLTQLVRRVRPWLLVGGAVMVAGRAHTLLSFVRSVPVLMVG